MSASRLRRVRSSVNGMSMSIPPRPPPEWDRLNAERAGRHRICGEKVALVGPRA